jgi:phosphatidate cytidylyltransferase
MLKTRLITAFMLIPVVLAAVWLPQTPVPWATLGAAFWVFMALREFYGITMACGAARPHEAWGLFFALAFLALPYFADRGQLALTAQAAFSGDWARLMQAWLTLAVVVTLLAFFGRRDKHDALASWAWTLAGVLYLGWLTSHYLAMRDLPQGAAWVTFALFVTFASDSAAFLVGRLLGRHQLAPSISPKKTWEGAVGGVAGAVAGGIFLSWLLKLPMSVLTASLLAVAVSIIGQAGDLAESLFKRNTGAKDSGNALPGHGGFLDRTDSVVFAGLVVYYYVIWMH